MGTDAYDFGARLRGLREEQGLSKRALSRQAHVNRDTINRYETYLELPHGNILKKLAKTLHTTTDYLLGMPDGPAIKYYDLSKEEEQAVRLLIAMLTRLLQANEKDTRTGEPEER